MFIVIPLAQYPLCRRGGMLAWWHKGDHLIGPAKFNLPELTHRCQQKYHF